LCAGNLALAERDYPAAIHHLEIAIALDPLAYRPSGMIVQADVGTGDKQHVEAAARRLASRCEKLLELEPDHGGALGHMVAALAELGEVDRARAWARRAQLFDPENVRLLYNLACGMVRLGDFDAACELLEGVLNKVASGWLLWIDKDNDFDSIRSYPRFSAMMAKARERFVASGSQVS
jgi:tetratricopeptide (TPR) repeat protein